MSEFDSVYRGNSSLTLTVPAYGSTLSSLLTAQKIYQKPFSYTNLTTNQTVSNTIYLGFGKYDNPFYDLYQGAFFLSQQYSQTTSQMAFMDFDKRNAPAFWNPDDGQVVTRIYYSEAKAVAFYNLTPYSSSYRTLVVECSQQQYYSITTEACVTASECLASRGYIKNSMCLTACYSNYFSFPSGSGHYCYQQCPQHLGLVANTTSFTCT